MLARRLDPPDRPPERGVRPDTARTSATQRAEGRWRRPDREPTRGPQGTVRWWERPAPRGDTLLWAAVQRLQARRIARRLPVGRLAAELAAIGHPVRRETLSRVLNGKQRTSWDTAGALAEVLGVDLDDLRARRDGPAEDDERAGDEDEDPGATVVPFGR